MRPLQNPPFYPISASPIIGIYTTFRQAQILILKILNVWMPVPIDYPSGWLKISPSLNLNKNEHFSKVSPFYPVVRSDYFQWPVNLIFTELAWASRPSISARRMTSPASRLKAACEYRIRLVFFIKVSTERAEENLAVPAVGST